MIRLMFENLCFDLHDFFDFVILTTIAFGTYYAAIYFTGKDERAAAKAEKEEHEQIIKYIKSKMDK